MPIYPWTKEGAILITKAARYVAPAVIAVWGITVGYLVRKWREKRKADKESRVNEQR